MALNWKNGGSWEAITADALYSTYGGTYHVEYPPAQETAIDGTQAAATGKPRIVIEAPWMTDTGMGFWRSRLGSATARTAAISIEAWDPQSGSATKWAGTLQRPKFDGVSVGSSAGATIYRNVKIEIWECSTTT
jgi:hypothetical protein